MRIPRFLERPAFHVVLIALLGLIIYSNTFDVPFQWDDKELIANNYIIRDFSGLLKPSSLKGFEYYNDFKSRYISYLTFAVNYRLHGLDVAGYHVFNLVVHILNALLVYAIVIYTFGTPAFHGSFLKSRSKYIALLSSLLFISHPIQTQAVTYIYQRHAALVAFFYLSSFALYVKFRISTDNSRRYVVYFCALALAMFAMTTKENAFTLPLAIVLYEVMFFKGAPKKRVVYLLPFLLTMAIIPLTVMDAGKPLGAAVETATRIQPNVSRGDYLITQFPVIVTYLRLLAYPKNQNLDYDYPLYHSLLSPQVFFSAVFLFSIFILAVSLYFKSRKGDPGLGLVSFGMLWFFIALSTESSVIVLADVIFEHRVYLPSAGAFPAFTTGIFLICGRRGEKRFALAAFTAALIVLSAFTFARNNVWRSEISLWSDVVKKSPHKARGHHHLAMAYENSSMRSKAVEHYQTAIGLVPTYAEAIYNLGLIYESKGQTDKAIELYESALRANPLNYRVLTNLGVIYTTKGLTDKAIELYESALRVNQSDARAHNNLGVSFCRKGRLDAALEHFQAALGLKPDYVDARLNLGLLYLNGGMAENARNEFETVLRIDPNNSQARQALDHIGDVR